MKLFKKDELKILWPFYLEYLIGPILFFAPAFLVVYFASLGLTFFQIGVLMSVWPLSTLIFEIPTGAIADLYGRKFSVLLGYFLEAILLFLLFLVKEYYLILIFFALWGFATTLSSGSKEAWVIDLIKRKNEKLVKSFFHKIQSLGGFALIISGIVGALLVKKFGISIIWIFASFSYIIAIFILMLGKEKYIKRKVKIKESFKDLFKQTQKTVSYGYRHYILFYYLVATFLFAFAANFSSGLTWVPLLQNLNFPDYAFGYMWSALAFITTITPFFSNKFLIEGKEKRFIIIGTSTAALFAVLILFPRSWFYALLFLLLLEFFIQLRTPASKIYFHRFIPSKLRATMGSVKAMLISIAAIISTPIIGYLVDLIGARYTVLLYAPLAIPVILIYLKIKEKS